MERDAPKRTHRQGNRTNGCRLGFLIHILGCIQPVGEIQPVYLCHDIVAKSNKQPTWQDFFVGVNVVDYATIDFATTFL